MKPIRLLLADDLMLIRHGIRALLSSVEDVDIVGEGLAATRSIKEQLPDIEIIVMTDRLDDVKALQAIDAGATGYILKDITAGNLPPALRAVAYAVPKAVTQ